MAEPDLVLEFEIEKGRSPDIENVARALLAWNDAVQAACAAIMPNAKVVVELVAVEHGSQRYKQVLRFLEDVAEAVEEGGAEYPLIWKHTKALAKCIAGGILLAGIANQMDDTGVQETLEEIRDLLREDIETHNRGQEFYGILQEEPSFAEVRAYEGNSDTPFYSVPRSEFAFKSGLFLVDEDSLVTKEEERVGTWDVVLIRGIIYLTPETSSGRYLLTERVRPDRIRRKRVTHEELRRKARYGHRAYLYWTSPNGEFRFAPYGKPGIKAALMDVGAKGRFFWFDAAGNSNIARSLSYMIHLWRCAGA